MLAFEVVTASGRKLTLAALPWWGNEINSGSSCFHLPSFMLSVGFPLICWIYVLWRVALTESLLFFPLSFSFWASRSRALAAIIISRAAHTPDPFAPRRILRRRSSVLVIFYYVTCEIFFFFFKASDAAPRASTIETHYCSLTRSKVIRRRPLTQSLCAGWQTWSSVDVSYVVEMSSQKAAARKSERASRYHSSP